ncbi:Inorganic triphosphatase [Pasteurella multocida]|uniref:CYTH domain-containing protein n=1 Tax=Pasteurella multocida TaxID=747 RepID=UPI00102D5E57|nr:inorganic triphosphatase [Pasteurella multocida]TAA83840.1 Inorganic triphosphatase [Pasteurella multocida]
MGNEVELKLAVTPKFADLLHQELTNFRILAHNTIFLANTYYDTADRVLAKHKMGLRVRQENQQYTLTLKTDGEVHGGLHIRPEYNVILPDGQPNISLLVEKYALALPNYAQWELKPVFSTDFERESWLIECGNGTHIEVAFDQGKIVAGEKQTPICEVEFELKSGLPIDLLRFVQTLTLENEIRLSSASKAKRGYLLANTTSMTVTNWLEKWREFLQFTQNTTSAVAKLSALFRLEQDLIEETFAIGADYFSADFLRTVERIGAFFNLYHYYVEQATLLDSALNQQVGEENLACEQTYLLDLLDSHHSLLQQVRELIRLHSESQDNRLVLDKLLGLLQTGHYVKRMIHLTFLTLSN